MNKPEVGRILYSTNGYDCVQVSFYEVVKTTPKTVTLVKVRKAVSAQGKEVTRFVVPSQVQIGKPFTRKVKDFGTWWSVHITSYEFANEVYDDTPVAETTPFWY